MPLADRACGARILVVESDVETAAALKFQLELDHFTVDNARADKCADQHLERTAFDLVVLDRDQRELDGIQVLRRFRNRGGTTPILVLAADNRAADCAAALDAGADDYMFKPFNMAELRARVRALLRRRPGAQTTVIQHGRLSFDLIRQTARVNGASVELSPREACVLESLLLGFGRVVKKERILDRLYGLESTGGLNTVEVYVFRLRKKLQDSGLELRTVHGQGYRLGHARSDEASGRRPSALSAPLF